MNINDLKIGTKLKIKVSCGWKKGQTLTIGKINEYDRHPYRVDSKRTCHWVDKEWLEHYAEVLD